MDGNIKVKQSASNLFVFSTAAKQKTSIQEVYFSHYILKSSAGSKVVSSVYFTAVVSVRVRSRDKFHWNFVRPGNTHVSCCAHLSDGCGQREKAHFHFEGLGTFVPARPGQMFATLAA